jgi:hypothetical protein
MNTYTTSRNNKTAINGSGSIKNKNNTISSNSSNSIFNNKTESRFNFTSILIILIIIILVAIAAYWLYNKYWAMSSNIKSNQVEVINDIRDASSKTSIGSGLIPQSNYSNEYSISFWLNISNYDYNYGKEKIIMRRGTGNPEILLDAKNNDLIVRVQFQGSEITNTTQPTTSKSSFQDIIVPIRNCAGPVITKDEPYYTYDKFELSGNIPLTDFKNVDSSKVASNEIDYPTISYINPSNLKTDYFDLISGNTFKQIKEGFTAQDDAINAISKVLLDVCDIANLLQSKTIAAESSEQMKLFFDMILKGLDELEKEATKIDDIATEFSTSIKSLPNQEVNSILLKKVETLAQDFKELEKYNDVELNILDMKNIINEKLKGNNCPLTFDGTTEVDNTISFAKNIVKLIRSTLFTYITNLGESFNKNAGGGSCVPSVDDRIGMCVAKMIPLQKWVNVIVSIYNQIIDIYIDGQLISSCVLKGFPAISNETVEITPDGGFAGKISRVIFSNSACTVSDARSIYNDGPFKTQNIIEIIPWWVWYIIIFIFVLVVVYFALA